MGATDWNAYLDVVAPAVGLALEPAWRPGVARFLDLAAEMAARLEAVDLGDTLELDATLILPEGSA